MTWLFLCVICITYSIVIYACIVNIFKDPFKSVVVDPQDQIGLTDNAFISVILPIKTIKLKHIKLLQQLEEQTCCHYEVIVVYENQELPKVPNIFDRVQLVKNNNFFTAKRSNKVSNLLFGIDKISPISNIIIFLDDDITIDKTFLEIFQGYVKTYPFSIITSFRYVKEARSIRDYLLLLTNNSIATLMFLPRWRCIWGGCFGFHRDILDKVNLRRVWSESISDDLDLTQQAMRLSIPIVVATEPLCKSEQFIESYIDLVNWGIRQFRLARFYSPRSYRDSIIISTFLVYPYIQMYTLFRSNSIATTIILLMEMVAILIIYVRFYLLNIRIHFYKYIILMPLVPVMVLIIAIIALLGDTIEWQGSKYLLKKQAGQSLL